VVGGGGRVADEGGRVGDCGDGRSAWSGGVNRTMKEPGIPGEGNPPWVGAGAHRDGGEGRVREVRYIHQLRWMCRA